MFLAIDGLFFIDLSSMPASVKSGCCSKNGSERAIQLQLNSVQHVPEPPENLLPFCGNFKCVS
jgi:hypothetical protein